MKRVIKFRGKVKYNGHYLFAGDWIYGDLIQTKFGCYISQTDFIPALSIPADKFIEVNPDTVGQFTGRLNDQGVELYEGDRYKWPNGKGGEVGEIIFEDGMFCCKSPHKTFALNSMYISFEVIGTIHDTKPAT